MKKMAIWDRGMTGAALSTLMFLSPDASAGSHVSCLTQGFVPLQEAHEIFDMSTVNTDPQAPTQTYKGSGSNPVPDSVWASNYQPPPPYVRNTTRYLQFNESQFISSPGQTV